jgi:hypothetical protein
MSLEELLRFHNELIQFDSTKPIVVTWSETTGLVYRQFGRVQAFPYMNNYFFPKPKLELGVLMPTDYEELIKGLETLIQDPALKSNSINSIIGNFEFKLYKELAGLVGPQLVYHFRLTTFTNKWISKWHLRRADLETQNLLKAINNENRTRRNRRPENR